MNSARSVTQSELLDFLLQVAVVCPVFIWGSPGIGKSAMVETFAKRLGLDCVSLLGSQLAPEDIIGVPQIVDGKSVFCPPKQIARSEPYCLFLDELNACSHEVQKAFYSLIHEHRIGEYTLPKGSIVIGAGNRAQDSAIVKPMSSALINRMMHIQLTVSHRDWLVWAHDNAIHPQIIEYIQQRPDHLKSEPPKHEEAFSTPRSWHILSDAMKSYGETITPDQIKNLAAGVLTPAHATQFTAFIKQLSNRYQIAAIIKGDASWPHKSEDRDVLYFLAQSFRAQLTKQLPQEKEQLSGDAKELAFRAKRLIKDLAEISLEIAQMVVTNEEDQEKFPDWLLIEIVRDLPRLVVRK